MGKRIVHRDIKPDNVLLRPSGVPVIIDLGIARLLDSDSLTHSNAARGPCTPVYAAPEQLRNRKADIDPRTDQFALGILLVQLSLNGQHPFDPAVVGSGDSIVENILAKNWARGRTAALPAGLCALADRLLGGEPYERFRRPEGLLDVIRQLQVDNR